MTHTKKTDFTCPDPAPRWAVETPNGVLLTGFATEAEASAYAHKYNGPRFGDPARRGARRYIVVQS